MQAKSAQLSAALNELNVEIARIEAELQRGHQLISDFVTKLSLIDLDKKSIAGLIEFITFAMPILIQVEECWKKLHQFFKGINNFVHDLKSIDVQNLQLMLEDGERVILLNQLFKVLPIVIIFIFARV